MHPCLPTMSTSQSSSSSSSSSTSYVSSFLTALGSKRKQQQSSDGNSSATGQPPLQRTRSQTRTVTSGSNTSSSSKVATPILGKTERLPTEKDHETSFIVSIVERGELLFFPVYLHTLIENCFKQLDVKGSGSLDSETFSDVIPYVHIAKQRLWQQLIKTIDFDGDGGIDVAEFKKFFILKAVRLTCDKIHTGAHQWDKVCLKRCKEFSKGHEQIKGVHQLSTVGMCMEGAFDRLFSYICMLVDDFKHRCSNLDTSKMVDIPDFWEY